MKDLKISLAGLSHRATITTREELAEATPLKVKLQREPDNRHDDNAIAVIVVERPYQNYQIGYVPKQIAAVLAPQLDSNKTEVSEAWVTAIEPISSAADLLVTLKRPRKPRS